MPNAVASMLMGRIVPWQQRECGKEEKREDTKRKQAAQDDADAGRTVSINVQGIVLLGPVQQDCDKERKEPGQDSSRPFHADSDLAHPQGWCRVPGSRSGLLQPVQQGEESEFPYEEAVGSWLFRCD